MRIAITATVVCCACLFITGCYYSPQPMGTVVVEEPTVETKREEIPYGISPKQTSKDSTYGYTIKNPIKIGSTKYPGDPKVARLYFRHLRDAQFRQIRFKRVGSFGGNPDGHNTDKYEIIDQDGNTKVLWIDKYHDDKNPLKAKAPKGMYMSTD